MTNGAAGAAITDFLYWAVTGLLAVAGTLVSLLVRMHVTTDEKNRVEDKGEESAYRARIELYWREQQQRLEGSLKELEEKVHKYRNEMNRISTRMRWADEDKASEGNGRRP
jgi:predicted RNase H-like nuclease (RuvC/YqgF family)